MAILLISTTTWFMLSKSNIKNQEPAITLDIAKEFIIHSKNFSFEPAVIKAKLIGEIKITLKNTDSFYDLKIDEFNIATEKLNYL